MGRSCSISEGCLQAIKRFKLCLNKLKYLSLKAILQGHLKAKLDFGPAGLNIIE